MLANGGLEAKASFAHLGRLLVPDDVLVERLNQAAAAGAAGQERAKAAAAVAVEALTRLVDSAPKEGSGAQRRIWRSKLATDAAHAVAAARSFSYQLTDRTRANAHTAGF